ncbi:MAG: ABC transporter permease [Clostridia bacterium]|jgi:ABC-type transport system involved in multi-copper enzyme maturation permease subunit|nr:ABC transporter permease [Clostridia bacterium]
MARQLCLLARLGLLEILHKRILVAVLLLTLAYLFLFGLALHYLTQDQGPFDLLGSVQLFTMALYLATFLTSLLSVLVSVGAIAGEIEGGTAYALLARPVSRMTVLLGKYCGYAAFLGLYAALFFLGLWAVVAWQGGVLLAGIGEALALFILQPLVLLSLTFLASTAFSAMGAGAVVFLLYGLSLVAGMVEQVGALLAQAGQSGAAALVNLGILASLLLPVDALYRRAAFSLLENTENLWQGLGAMGPFGVASVPSVWMVVYAGGYLAVTLYLAVRRFQARDI